MEIKERISQNHWVQSEGFWSEVTDGVNCRKVRALQGAGGVPILTAAAVGERVLQRVGSRADGGAVLTVRLRQRQEPFAGLGAGRGLRERAHALTTLWLDELPHLQRDPVAPPAETVTLIM